MRMRFMASAFAKTARLTASGEETMYEMFRILDNFNVPLGAAEGEGKSKIMGLRSSTLLTTTYDTKNLIMQYHTMHQGDHWCFEQAPMVPELTSQEASPPDVGPPSLLEGGPMAYVCMWPITSVPGASRQVSSLGWSGAA